MTFKYTPIAQFSIRMITRADKLRQQDGEGTETKRMINKAYLVRDHGLSFAHLVVHLVPGSKTDWIVSERFTGTKIVEEPSKSKDTAVRAAITRIKMVGRSKYQEAIAKYK